MTREEFYEQTCCWADIVDFCRQYDLCTCNNIYASYEIEEMLCEALHLDGGIGTVQRIIMNIDNPDANYFLVQEGNIKALDDSEDFADYRDQLECEYEERIGFDEEYDDYDDEDGRTDSEEDYDIDEKTFYSILAS